MMKNHQSKLKIISAKMALSNNRGLYFTKLFMLAVILELTCEAAEVLNGENPRELIAIENDQPQELIILPDNYFEKRSNLNKFKSKKFFSET